MRTAREQERIDRTKPERLEKAGFETNRCQCKCGCERQASKCPDGLCGICCSHYEKANLDHGPKESDDE